MRIYVTRHGETDYNVQGRYCGSTDIGLNDAGLAQACELAVRLKKMVSAQKMTDIPGAAGAAGVPGIPDVPSASGMPRVPGIPDVPGDADVPIMATAQSMAGITGMPNTPGIMFDAVVSSPMLRARQTADIVCEALGMPYIVYGQFTERDMGVYEGLTKDEAKERYPELWNRQCTSKPDDAPDGGESLRQACARIDEGMERLRGDYRINRDGYDVCVLIICHGFTARAIHRYCQNLSFEEMSGFFLKNCEIAEYILDEKRLEI